MTTKKRIIEILLVSFVSLLVTAGLSRSAIESYNYDAFGNVLNFEPATAQTKLLYSGEQYDPRAKNYYLRSRYYDPATGRFNRPDPYAGNIRDPMSLHKYAYAQNDPVNKVDPSGMTSTYTTHEMLMVQGIQQNLITTVIGSAGITGMFYLHAQELNRALIEREIRLFVQTRTAPGAFTQAEFERLKHTIITQTRNKHGNDIFLHYGFQEDWRAGKFIRGMLPGSWVTKTVYLTGWHAKLKLAQFRKGPRDAIYVVWSDKEAIGPTYVPPRTDEETGIPLPGGGQQWFLPSGTSPGTVIGYIPIQKGSLSDILPEG